LLQRGGDHCRVSPGSTPPFYPLLMEAAKRGHKEVILKLAAQSPAGIPAQLYVHWCPGALASRTPQSCCQDLPQVSTLVAACGLGAGLVTCGGCKVIT
jgi:hypothetical protein